MTGRLARCIAVYEDGREFSFIVPEATLERGDYILKILAGEKQRAGNLPVGSIKDARRAPPGGSFP
jgi:hypothetical protein